MFSKCKLGLVLHSRDFSYLLGMYSGGATPFAYSGKDLVCVVYTTCVLLPKLGDPIRFHESLINAFLLHDVI